MDVLESRYVNFKAFCHQLLPENDFVKLLQTTPLELFLQTIKSKNDAHKTVDEIVDIIFEKANIDGAKLDTTDINKFNRYVSYFSEYRCQS